MFANLSSPQQVEEVVEQVVAEVGVELKLLEHTGGREAKHGADILTLSRGRKRKGA